MQFSVLLVLLADSALRQSAAEAMLGTATPVDLSGVRVPRIVKLDSKYRAVPLGKRIPPDVFSLRDYDFDKSEVFCVRGFVEANKATEIPRASAGFTIFSDPRIVRCETRPIHDINQPAFAGSTSAEVARRLDVDSLGNAGLDGSGVGIAIVDSGFNVAHLRRKLGLVNFDRDNSWSMPNSDVTPGRRRLVDADHGTMCAFDALIAAPKATLLDFPMFAFRPEGLRTSEMQVNQPLAAFAAVLRLWQRVQAPNVNLPKVDLKALVVNNSWALCDKTQDFATPYFNNPNHPLNRKVKALAGLGVDIVFAAGNCGKNSPANDCGLGADDKPAAQRIMGTNALPEVLTIAGCDTLKRRVGYSSQGPAISGMPAPRRKPDVTAYTHFVGAKAFQNSETDVGTSAASAVASGCVAALRTKVSPRAMPPAKMIAQIRESAAPVGAQSRWHRDFGFGIIDPVNAGTRLGVIP